MKPSTRTALAVALVMAAAAILHAGSLGAPFFADDYLFLDQARGRSLWSLLGSPDPLGNYLRPISRQVWFWSLGGASGESARAFHAANLALFLGILWLMHRVARRFLPPHAALSGVAVLALHHAADVPLLWASGSQDLLAVLGSLAAIELHARGRRGFAALVMGLALLSKETVIFAPFLAIWIARRPSESVWRTVRRGWPQLATLAAWAGVWLATASRRPVMSLEVQVTKEGAPAALLHLAQSALGLEIPYRGLGAAFHAAPPLALVPALMGVAWLALSATTAGNTQAANHTAPSRPAGKGKPRPASAPTAETSKVASRVDVASVGLLGVAWAILGAIPVIAVAAIWSAYYYLFSLCGVALLSGALVARAKPWMALLPVLIVGTASENARRLTEFAIERGVWSTQSHLNRHYFDRGMKLADHVMAGLKRLRPTLAPRTTLYFAGLPHSIAFQAGDGPLVRWAYRDSTLRSYYFTGFRLAHARRGPTHFFNFRRDSLVEITGADSLERIAMSLILSEASVPARDILLLDWERSPSIETAYRLAWVVLAMEGLGAARPWLERAKVEMVAGPTPEVERALASVQRGDTVSALATALEGVWKHGLDPGAHALMADLLLATRQRDPGAVEAYAVRALAPEDPGAWRRWGMVEAVESRDLEAVRALERYLALAGIRESDDPEAAEVLAQLRRRVPGGDIAQAELGRVTTP